VFRQATGTRFFLPCQVFSPDTSSLWSYPQTRVFAVVGEYFFERPQLLKQNHPELYALLSQAFQQDTATLLRVTDFFKEDIGRNDPCPCGSGKKFKKCCGGATNKP